MKTLRFCALLGMFQILSAMACAGDSIVVGVQFEPPHLDPTSASAGAIDQVLYANVFEGLTRFGPDGSVQPGLAESWMVTENGTEYLFRLRTGVTFHDGTGMDARDVKFTLDRARDETSQNAQKNLFDGIEEVEVLSPELVKITLKEPDGNFLFNLAWGDAVIVAPESIGDIRQEPVGTGAFRFGEWVQGERIVLERNPDYWGTPARLETATFRFIEDPEAAMAALLAEEVHAFPAFPAPERASEFAADPRFQVLIGSTESETILAINNQRPPLDDRRVRRAIAHAIDRRAVIDGAMAGLGMPIGSHFAPHRPEYIDLTELSTYDPALAIQLLAEAGFEDGFEVTLKLPPPRFLREAGGIVAAQLRAVGLDVTIIELDWPQWSAEVFQDKDYGLSLVSHNEPYDIGIYTQPDYYFQYESVPFRAVMKELRTISDPEKRAEWLAAAQRLIAEDYVNAFLFQLAAVTVADARLRGLWPNAPIQATDLTGVYWED